LKISGKIVKGHGIASGISKNNPYPKGSLEMQFPFFKDMGLDLYSFYLGTINIDISPFVWKPLYPDSYLENVKWIDQIPPESFLFFECKLIFNAIVYDGMIYLPDPKTKVQHFQRDDMIEVLSVKIPGIDYGKEILISIPDKKIDINKKDRSNDLSSLI
jgi:hypothetical protein